ncbi:RNA-directed DNA polymerase from mobile element jockey [Trichonephila clavipes]|nr:RNA-directed DNA polymerase from mobile element jockey [Trichonephila clavipes]
MPRRRIRVHCEQLSEFERGRTIGLKDADWAKRRIAGHMDRSNAAIIRYWQQWEDSGRFQRHDGSARTEHYAICHLRLYTVEPDYSGAWLDQVGITLNADVECLPTNPASKCVLKVIEDVPGDSQGSQDNVSPHTERVAMNLSYSLSLASQITRSLSNRAYLGYDGKREKISFKYNYDDDCHKEIRSDALIYTSVTDDPPFTIHEINAVINKLKLKKAPGPDSIPNEVVKKLHEMYPDLFLTVFNSCLRLKTFPRCWKNAKIILIPKVNDVRVPKLDNLRCISLLSTLGKCFERLIINRVAWRLYKDNYFNKNQFGFMPHKCTEDALVKLNEIVLKGKKRNLHTVLVFLDIKSAFDNAWWPGILSLLKRSSIPGNLFAVISSFLKDRSVTLSLGHSSKEKFLNKGCPQ